MPIICKISWNDFLSYCKKHRKTSVWLTCSTIMKINQLLVVVVVVEHRQRKLWSKKNHDLKGTKHQSIAWQSVVGSLVHAK